jgi:hypothetical protein
MRGSVERPVRRATASTALIGECGSLLAKLEHLFVGIMQSSTPQKINVNAAACGCGYYDVELDFIFITSNLFIVIYLLCRNELRHVRSVK